MSRLPLKLPKGVTPEKYNISEVSLPYYILSQGQTSPGSEKKWLVFWGVPVRNLEMVYADPEEFIRRSNACLDYLRKYYLDCELIYKPHPNETDEISLLNLKDFRVLPEKTVAEFFTLKNYPKIQHVFSTYSSATTMSYKLGLDAHIFLPFVEVTFTPENKQGNREYFKGMPSKFFLDNLKQKASENKLILPTNPDPVLVEELSSRLQNKDDMTVWSILGDPGSLTSVIALTKLVKQISPKTRTGLIIERHHRWDVMNMNEVRSYFDTTLVYPRILPSLRPQKIWSQIKTARVIRRAPISAQDIFFCCNYTSLVENCFISYFPENQKLAFVKKETLQFCYTLADPTILGRYITRPGRLFYQKIVEPLLGLQATLYLEDPVRVANFDRYRKPINDVYDHVFVY